MQAADNYVAMRFTRRDFLKTTGIVTAGTLLPVLRSEAEPASVIIPQHEIAADYTLRIAATPVELSPKLIVSITTYNGQFPGPLLRFKEGQPVTVDIFNDTDTPEQLHWHGRSSADVDGAAEEGTPYIPAHGKRRITFTPRPLGAALLSHAQSRWRRSSAGQYSGQVGPVYIEPKTRPGRYDREVFLTLKEFEPTFSRGGDMARISSRRQRAVQSTRSSSGETAMKASLAKGMPHGYEVGYGSFTINGRMLGHGEPIRVKYGERVLFHILNGSATEIRSLALPGHTFRSRGARRQSRAESRRGSGAVAGHRRTRLGHRGDESSRRVDHGRPGRR